MKDICDNLTRELCDLPARGEGYSGIHPAWCFLIACACTDASDGFTKMYGILESIGNANKSVRPPFKICIQSQLTLQNVLDLCMLVNWIWEWKKGRLLTGQWWEEMTEHLDSKMGNRLICVS